ncbi:hypothetical protein F5Y15DRAFT_64898 [Xylariaceae sp. FL0016]|nr:hypothetical protein F5Y15DRAFT_64898 [Xylariaceae sp. FL0016]
MVMSTVTAVAWRGCLLWVLAFLVDVVSAGQATTVALPSVPEYQTHFPMRLELTAAESPALVVDYGVVPLTGEAGLNQTNNAINAFDVRGNLVNVDPTNFNNLTLADTIALMSCDPNDDSSFISPTDMLNDIMTNQGNKPNAILLYSTQQACCSLGGSDLPFTSVWTMRDRNEVWDVKNITAASTGTVLGAITANSTTSGGSDSQQGGNNSAVAMSILYSITGLITLLFLIIIVTGAVRAHRHPERYGPRAGVNGRPRQSRAKGLARAVLETLPIVKFGDPEPGKADPENELESVSGDKQRPPSYQRGTATTDTAEPSTANPVIAITDADAEQSSSSTTAAAVSRPSEKPEPIGEEHLGCSICTEDFTVGEDVRVLPCDHKFHPGCVDPWLVNVSGTCPLCRLDLRPQGTSEGQSSEPSSPTVQQRDSQSAPQAEGDAADLDSTQRRRRSRLLDWNRLRHASVDERIQALRQYRQSQQVLNSAPNASEEQTRPTISDRMRERFHLRPRAQSPEDASSS